MKPFLLLTLIGCGGQQQVILDPVTDSTQPTEEQILEWIEQLGDEDWEVREEAAIRILQFGVSAQPILNENLQHPNLEIQSRINLILQDIQEIKIAVEKCHYILIIECIEKEFIREEFEGCTDEWLECDARILNILNGDLDDEQIHFECIISIGNSRNGIQYVEKSWRDPFRDLGNYLILLKRGSNAFGGIGFAEGKNLLWTDQGLCAFPIDSPEARFVMELLEEQEGGE